MKLMAGIGRVLGSLSALFGLLAGLGLLAIDSREYTLDPNVLAALALLAAAAVLLAWFRLREGGIATFVAGIAHSVLAYVEATERVWLAVLVWGAPLLLAGVLMAMASFGLRASKVRK